MLTVLLAGHCAGAVNMTLPEWYVNNRVCAHTRMSITSNCELNALVATLSTGPLSIADKPGDTNATLLRRCIAADGRILQPDKPATAVDSMFARPAPPHGCRTAWTASSPSPSGP